MANDFSSDPNCVALWKFDNNPNDSKGNNDLTLVNSPTYNSGDKKEGTHSLELERDNSQYLYRADADLDAGFPGKSGTSEQSFSICFWMKLETLPGSVLGIVSKSVSGDRCYEVYVYSSDKLRFAIGYSGGSTAIEFDSAFSTGIWYHVAVTYDSSDNSMEIRIWDDDAGALLNSNKEDTAGGDMLPNARSFEIGRWWELDARTFDGKIDEVVIFKDVLADDEIDQIRAGTYGAATEKESSDAGSGLEASNVEGEGQPKDISTSESAEGADGLAAKIEMPTKGGGMKLWT